MDALTTALIGGLAGGTIGALITAWVTLTAQGREHDQQVALAEARRVEERAQAHLARIQERRVRAYEGALELAYLLDMSVERAAPFIGPKPDPPKPVKDRQVARLNALVAAHASAEVKEMAREMNAAAASFQAHAWRVSWEHAHPSEGDEGYRPLAEARERFVTVLRAIADRMAEELQAA